MEGSLFVCKVPVILALIGVWYSNIYGAESYTMLPYDQVTTACKLLPLNRLSAYN